GVLFANFNGGRARPFAPLRAGSRRSERDARAPGLKERRSRPMIFEWLKSRKPARLRRSGPSVKGVWAVLALVAISEPLRLRAQSAGWEPCAKRQIPIASKIRCADALHAGCTSATGPSEPQAKQTLLVAVVDENNVAVPTV